MFKYNQENGFDRMNYVLAGLCFLILLIPTNVILKEKQMSQELTAHMRNTILIGNVGRTGRSGPRADEDGDCSGKPSHDSGHIRNNDM